MVPESPDAHSSLSGRESKTGINRLRTPEPVLIGIVQFTPGIVQREIEFEPDAEAIKVLAKHTLTAHHQAIGISTWKAKLISIDDDHLGTPFIENATEG